MLLDYALLLLFFEKGLDFFLCLSVDGSIHAPQKFVYPLKRLTFWILAQPQINELQCFQTEFVFQIQKFLLGPPIQPSLCKVEQSVHSVEISRSTSQVQGTVLVVSGLEGQICSSLQQDINDLKVTLLGGKKQGSQTIGGWLIYGHVPFD